VGIEIDIINKIIENKQHCHESHYIEIGIEDYLDLQKQMENITMQTSCVHGGLVTFIGLEIRVDYDFRRKRGDIRVF